MMELLRWLQSWYSDQCDGNWEHEERIRLSTLDNPGWRLSIGLIDTPLDGRPFEAVSIERSDSDWLQCSVKDSVFSGACGAQNLIEMIEVFRDWAISGLQ